MALRPSLTAVAAVAILAAATALPSAQGTKRGNPEEHLPPNVHQLTAFGERASWSPDASASRSCPKASATQHYAVASAPPHPRTTIP
jgi:hypothetical protein